jgi:hypothetical protein
MTTPLVPETTEPIVDPSQTQPDPSTKPEPEIKNAPVVPVQYTPSIDPRVLTETIRENVRLRAELEANKKVTIPVVDAKEFFDKPMEHVRSTVQNELKEQIAPLHEFIRQFKAKDELSTLKAKYANNPAYNLDKLGPVVDQLLANTPNVNEENFRAAVFAANGMYNTNELAQYGIPYVAPSNSPTPTAPPIRDTTMTRPAQLPPSPPAVPRKDNTPARTPLTESELINMRRFGLNEADMYAVREGTYNFGAEGDDIDSIRAMFPTKENK